MRLSVRLGTTYLAEIKNFFVESNVNKDKNQPKNVMKHMNNTKKI